MKYKHKNISLKKYNSWKDIYYTMNFRVLLRNLIRESLITQIKITDSSIFAGVNELVVESAVFHEVLLSRYTFKYHRNLSTIFEKQLSLRIIIYINVFLSRTSKSFDLFSIFPNWSCK